LLAGGYLLPEGPTELPRRNPVEKFEPIPHGERCEMLHPLPACYRQGECANDAPPVENRM